MISLSVSVIMTIIVSSAPSAANPWSLDARAFGSNVTCQSQFSWTDNSKNQSPCDLASKVVGPCAGPSWSVYPLKPNQSYSVPSRGNNTVNPCTCSWAAYNLHQACTLCQATEGAILTWSRWKFECEDKVSSTFFPTTIKLPEDTSIPAYAAHNPDLWRESRFNLEEAKAIHDNGDPDVHQAASPSPKSSSSVGAIVGGVVGGLAVILLGGLAAIVMYRRKQRRESGITGNGGAGGGMMGHSRNISDMSQKSNGSGVGIGLGYGYQKMDSSGGGGLSGSGSYGITTPSSPPPLSPRSMHTHTSSVNSLSYFESMTHNHSMSVSGYGPHSPPTGTRTLSPTPSVPPHHNSSTINNNNNNNNMIQPQQPQSLNAMSREGHITPFMLAPPPEAISREGSHTNLADRKRADGAIVPLYDQSNLHHNRNVSAGQQHQQQQQQQHHRADSGGSDSGAPRRFNPPSYDTVVDNTSAHPPAAHRTTRNEKSQHSPSNSNSSAETQQGVPAPAAAIDNVVMQMRRQDPLPPSNAGGNPQHYPH